jgi:hypothetical protein
MARGGGLAVTAGGPTTLLFEFEAFGAAVGSAVVCGALSVPFPTLDAPTATLAALALAGWVSLARRSGSLTRDRFGRGPVAALAALGGAGGLYLAGPDLLVPFRGLLLAGSLLPLFVLERTRTAHPPPVFSSA